MPEENDPDWDDDTGDETPESSEQQEAPESPDAQDTDSGDETIDGLRQKVRSAEGRFKKFEESLDGLRSELAEKETAQEEVTEPEKPGVALPAGWTRSDWDDFCADNPVEAELIEAQSEKLQSLQQRVDTSEQQRQEQDYARQFHQTVTGAHPDYDQLIANERDDIKAFIDSQPNTLMKNAFQRVYDEGSADEVVELVSQYKASKQPEQSSQKLNGDRRLEQSLAVPSRAPVPDSNRHGGLPSAGDEEAAWDYFPDDAI